jgi:endonuclease/exonuclease/phosphatase family metal-dependent hydrolase
MAGHTDEAKPIANGQTRNADSGIAANQQAFERGLIMIQIDGLGHKELCHALKSGEMPFLSRLIKSERYQLHSLYSGLPSSTPAVQGELFYGVKGAVPAFAFIHRTDGELNRMYEPASACRVEQEIERQQIPLLAGGSAYCDIYTGGAKESHFCSASLGWDDILHKTEPLHWLLVCLLSLPTFLRTLGLLLIEITIGIYDMLKGLRQGQKFYPEFKFVGARVAISILLRDLITMGAEVDINRGLPIIHLNYIGYDEQAHRRGPDSMFAHWSLRGIDRQIRRLWQASHHARHRHYDVWIYSDHGQEATLPYEKLSGSSLDEAVRRVLDRLQKNQQTALWACLDSAQTQRARLLGGTRIQRLFPTVLKHRNKIDLYPPAVVAMGPVGHIYLNEPSNTDTRSTLAKMLVTEEQVPVALYLDGGDCIYAQTATQLLQLPKDRGALFGESHPFLQDVTNDLMSLCRHDDAGDVVLLGWSKDGKPISFPEENGAHAGPGSNETHAFAMLPEDTDFKVRNTRHLRPLDLRQAALHVLGRETISNIDQVLKNSKSPQALRVMSYNVHSCIGMDSKIAPERIARVISRYQPDIIALQELDVGKHRSNSIHQAELIARTLEMQYHFHPAMHIEDEQYGDAILTHLPMKTIQAAALPNHPSGRKCEPRGVLWVSIEFNGVEIQVLNTHLGLFTAERYAQANELISERWLNHPNCNGPVILCGDLNALPRSYVLRTLGKRLNDVQTWHPQHRAQNTFSGRLPALRIDHILIDKFHNVSRIEVPFSDIVRLASDHLPLIADLIIE